MMKRIGRAKQKIQETTGSASSTTYSSEYFEQIALLEATRKQTATMVTAFDEMFNAYATDNRFECIGDVCNAFGNRLPPSDSRNTLVAVKKALDLVGLAHRTLYRNVTEHVVRPLRKWRKEEMQNVDDEVKQLEKCRLDMDFAANKHRSAPTLATEKQLAACTDAHEAQLDATVSKLDELNEQHNAHADILIRMIKFEQETFRKSSAALKAAIV